MRTFLGLGLGPIQTGIFLSGAHRGQMEIVVADVDHDLARGVRQSGGRLVINVAEADSIRCEIIEGVRVLNPTQPEELEELKDVASRADELCTALPSVAFYGHVAPWLNEGFLKAPQHHRLFYTAENDTTASDKLQALIDPACTNTIALDTVIGKMSGVVDMKDLQGRTLQPLYDGAPKAHLVESFNDILVQSTDHINARTVQGLRSVPKLHPFEESKLYGHNAVHFFMACHGEQRGYVTMDEIAKDSELMAMAETALIGESGQALCRRWKGVDPLFTPSGFETYAHELLQRIVNPFLNDRVERIVRDLPRKLGWDDRLIGALRLIHAEGGDSVQLHTLAHNLLVGLYGRDPSVIKESAQKLWGGEWSTEHENLFQRLF